ncbi:hypothetical protein CERSUDRAFT_124141 [Gelatoporia subvermispora B]|uniref:Uncharacterized protein n=1 Tax=Ceriporiopsis subvermispora (strain B) TaxID=914234 RepID=M2PLG8_CERS8|nr:hypothetical protein CERSUDRAFT_124141 [Gelatoporia subvermispora B]
MTGRSRWDNCTSFTAAALVNVSAASVGIVKNLKDFSAPYDIYLPLTVTVKELRAEDSGGEARYQAQQHTFAATQNTAAIAYDSRFRWPATGTDEIVTFTIIFHAAHLVISTIKQEQLEDQMANMVLVVAPEAVKAESEGNTSDYVVVEHPAANFQLSQGTSSPYADIVHVLSNIPPPRQWVTANEPMTPRQRHALYWASHFAGVTLDFLSWPEPENGELGVTKAEASELITVFWSGDVPSADHIASVGNTPVYIPDPDSWATGGHPLTHGQKDMIGKLAVAAGYIAPDTSRMTKAQATKLIWRMRSLSPINRRERRRATRAKL